jgi:hypothetical protein
VPLKGLTRAEATWLNRRVRALGSLEAALHALVLNGRRAEEAGRLMQHLFKATARPTGEERREQPH